jgi:hypothetical protein
MDKARRACVVSELGSLLVAGDSARLILCDARLSG